MERKPIDKTKPSNKRCVNCEYYKHTVRFPGGGKYECFCETGFKNINYWNCCAYFMWNADKVYKEVRHGRVD